MLPLRRLIPRIMFLVVVLVLFAAGGFLAWFQSWRAGRLLDLAARSELAALPAGEIEFAVRGAGPAVLAFHSAPGGYDQSLALAGFLEEAGFQILAPSRPGYLRTPLSTGATPEKQADAAMQLLEHLDCARVAVIGFGWGSSAAVEFARRFPARTAALVLVSAPTAEIPAAPGTPLPQLFAEKIGDDAGSWSLAKTSARNPGSLLRDAVGLTSTRPDPAWIEGVLQNPGVLERFQEAALSLAPLAAREAGWQNDLMQPLPTIRNLKTPVLLVHGAVDKAVPPGSVDKSRFAPAELLLLPGEGHLLLLGLGSPQAEARIVDFFQRHHSGGDQNNPTHGQ